MYFFIQLVLFFSCVAKVLGGERGGGGAILIFWPGRMCINPALILVVNVTAHLADVLRHPDHLLRVPVLVVVPRVQHHVLSALRHDRRVRVEHGAAVVAHHVRRHQLRVGLVGDLVHQAALKGGHTNNVVHLLTRRRVLDLKVQHRKRPVRRRHTHGVRRQLVLQVGDHLRHGRAGTGRRDDHVDGGGAATARLLVHVVQQVLVVRVGVDGLDVPLQHLEAVVHNLQHRADGVGGARGRREDVLLVQAEGVLVDAVHDVRHTLARRGQQHLRAPVRLQVTLQRLAVGVGTRVVDDKCVVDAVCLVVSVLRVLREDHLHDLPVHDDRLVLVVHLHRPLERAVYRVVLQQRRPLRQVLRRVAARHDRAQAQLLAPRRLLHELSAREAPDAAEAVQHNVARLEGRLALAGFRERLHLRLHELLLRRELVALRAVLPAEAADVDLRRRQVELQELLCKGGAGEDGEGLVGDGGGVVVQVEHLRRRRVQELVAQQHKLHAVVVQELADGGRQADRGTLLLHADLVRCVGARHRLRQKSLVAVDVCNEVQIL
eukprot:Rhum_TRINITY_DN14848_c17_g1::Rhum_TRINITY_DN14848_c17_g1_i1::g.122774::m.122774